MGRRKDLIDGIIKQVPGRATLDEWYRFRSYLETAIERHDRETASLYLDAEHQPRERAVPCSACHKDTWNNSAICDDCTESLASR